MKNRLAYEEFGGTHRGAIVDPIEKARSDGHASGFEDGYSSGWEDAIRSVEEKRQAISAELERSIRAAGLTASDALQEARREAIELLEALIDTLFEPILSDATCAVVRDRLAQATQDALEREIAVTAHPDTLARLRTLLCDDVDVAFAAEPTLAEDQVILDLADGAEMIDLTRLLAQLREGLAAASIQLETESSQTERERHADD